MTKLINLSMTRVVYVAASFLSVFAILSVNTASALYIYQGDVPEELLK